MSQADLNQLLVFAKVVEHGSFIAASRALGLPKTTVSRKVQELEERLGTRLLQRTTRRVALGMGADSLADLRDIGHLLASLKEPEPPKGLKDAGKLVQMAKASLVLVWLAKVGSGLSLCLIYMALTMSR